MGMLQQGVKTEGEVKRIIKSVEDLPSGTQSHSAAPLKTKHSGGSGKLGKKKGY